MTPAGQEKYDADQKDGDSSTHGPKLPK